MHFIYVLKFLNHFYKPSLSLISSETVLLFRFMNWNICCFALELDHKPVIILKISKR